MAPMIELPMIEPPRVEPSGAEVQRGTLHPRFEDIAQDGRVKIGALPASLGVVWRGLLASSSLPGDFQRAGVVPVLRRLVVEGGSAPLGLEHPIEVEGRVETAHTATDRRRFLLDIQVDLHGVRAHAYGPPPARAGERERVGGVYAEHVLTRPFAPEGQRRVDRIPDGIEPEPERPFVALEALLEPPEGAEQIDADPRPMFERLLAMADTDANQHVNSLDYPRLFEEAAVAAFGDGGLLARSVELVFGKPCFSGDSVIVAVARLRVRGRRGALATLRAPGESRPRCAARLLFDD